MTETNWHYITNGATVGPVSFAELVDLANRRSIDSETLVWEEGTVDWVRYADVAPNAGASAGGEAARLKAGAASATTAASRLAGAQTALEKAIPIDAAAPLPLQDQVNKLEKFLFGRKIAEAAAARPKIITHVDENGWTNEPVTPWRRNWARGFDNGILGIAIGFVLGFVFSLFAPKTLASLSPVGNGMVLNLMLNAVAYLLIIPILAFILGTTGTTPGKALFGIRVLDQNLQPIGVARAMKREILVCFRGLAFGIHLISLITMYLGYKRLVSIGRTSWDEDVDSVVIGRPSGQWVLISFVIGTVLFAAILFGLIILFSLVAA